jgi:hypothetical protein
MRRRGTSAYVVRRGAVAGGSSAALSDPKQFPILKNEDFNVWARDPKRGTERTQRSASERASMAG